MAVIDLVDEHLCGLVVSDKETGWFGFPFKGEGVV